MTTRQAQSLTRGAAIALTASRREGGGHRMRQVVVGAALLSATVLGRAPCAGQDSEAHGIITYGLNTPAWNARLHLAGVREACRETPEVCAKRISDHARQQNVRAMFLNIFLESPAVVRDAAAYSRISRGEPVLVEVGVDDFASHYYHLFKDQTVADPPALLRTVIGNLKAGNPALRFGVTLYEDDLASPFLQDAKLPSETRALVDYVHLYIHYRANGPAYATYVEEARRLFPQARVIAGAYAFDRIDYAPCTKGGTRCSRDEELALFERSFEVQVDLVKRGAVAAIEFYPANFGLEERWNGWDAPRNCAPARRADCVENTRAMRETADRLLRANRLVD
jgi:hypothetical protein